MTFATKRLGQVGEDLAVQVLKGQGYKVLARNFRSTYGELDIIAEGQGTLVFVEVKCRFPGQYGTPEEVVTPTKIRHIIKAGQYYLLLHPTNLDGPRIDVVAIEIGDDGRISRQEVIKNVTG